MDYILIKVSKKGDELFFDCKEKANFVINIIDKEKIELHERMENGIYKIKLKS